MSDGEADCCNKRRAAAGQAGSRRVWQQKDPLNKGRGGGQIVLKDQAVTTLDRAGLLGFLVVWFSRQAEAR